MMVIHYDHFVLQYVQLASDIVIWWSINKLWGSQPISNHLTPKGPLSVWTTNRILGRFATNTTSWISVMIFRKKLEIEKLIIFMGIYFFFQSVPGNKSDAQISSKQGRGGQQKKFESLNFYSWNFISL